MELLGLPHEAQACLIALEGELLGDVEETDTPLDGHTVGGRGPEARVVGALERLEITPHPCGPVVRRGDDALAVRAEGRCVERVLAAEDQRLAQAVGPKDADGPVLGRRDDARAVGAERG